MPRALPRLTADTKSVQELVGLMMRGQIRVPVYQRDLQWDTGDVLSLFDSIYRGFPIGALLLHQRPGPARTLHFGPLTIHAPEATLAYDVVDGQQRLVALTVCLARPDPLPTRATKADPYVVFFDPKEETFHGPHSDGDLPTTWVPLTALLDSTQLSEWVHHWPHSQDRDLRLKVFEAGARIREYKLPLYAVDLAETDADVLHEIFKRVNSSGKPLKWRVIHDALYRAHSEATAPSTIHELIAALADLGLGTMNEDVALRCLVAFEGRDVTRSYKELERDHPGFLAGTASRALPTLRRVLGFLRASAEVPHLRLLPSTAPLSVLTRFFRLHPEPSARSLGLLTWWLWRCLLAGDRVDDRTLQRRGVSQLDPDDEERSVQLLLDLVPQLDPDEFRLPERFDARAAATRLGLLGLASLQPRDLDSGRTIDLAALIESADLHAFRSIFNSGGELLQSPANRIFLPGPQPPRLALLAHVNSLLHSHVVLHSHAISPTARDALLAGRTNDFLSERALAIESATRALARRLTGANRRPHPGRPRAVGLSLHRRLPPLARPTDPRPKVRGQPARNTPPPCATTGPPLRCFRTAP